MADEFIRYIVYGRKRKLALLKHHFVAMRACSVIIMCAPHMVALHPHQWLACASVRSMVVLVHALDRYR